MTRALAIALASLAILGASDNVLQRARAKYPALKTYADKGTIEVSCGTLSERHTSRTYFRAPRQTYGLLTRTRRPELELAVVEHGIFLHLKCRRHSPLLFPKAGIVGTIEELGELQDTNGKPMVWAGVHEGGYGLVRVGPAAFKPGMGFFGLPGSYLAGKP